MSVSFLINCCENAVCKVYYLQNINENEEDLLSYPKVVIKNEKFTANHGSFPYDFNKEFSELVLNLNLFKFIYLHKAL